MTTQDECQTSTRPQGPTGHRRTWGQFIMIRSVCSRLKRHLLCTVVLLLGAGLLPAVAASAVSGTSVGSAPAALRATGLSGFITTRGSVLVGGELWNSVTVLPKAARTVTVQYRRAGTTAFTSASVARSSTLGVFSAGLKPPAAGTWQFRLVVAASAQATAFISPVRVVAASGRAAATAISGFASGAAIIELGKPVTDGVIVLPRATRSVWVQARRPGSAVFVTTTTLRTSAVGAVSALYQPTAVGVWQYRLVVAASAIAQSVTSPARTITARDTTAPGPVTVLKSSNVTDKSATLSWTNPTATDFSGVTIRQAVGPIAPSSPTAGTLVTNTGKTIKTFTTTGLEADTPYSYAVFARDGVPNYAAAAKVTLRTNVAPDLTAPGPVTALQATTLARTTVGFAWTNPVDADFTGAVIRRAVGATAPATVTDGTAVTDLPAPGDTFTDTGLTPATQYSYAVFAHDGGPNYAAAAELTVTTRTPLTDAVLSVNPLGLPTNKVTVDTPATFDASGSLAADGTTLVSGTLDYGDGQTDTFTTPFGPVDFWNTSHSYANTGPQTVTLSVTDSAGATDTTSVTVQVYDAPTASVSVTSGPAQVGVPVTFALDASTPAGTGLNSYALFFSGPESFHYTGNTAPAATQDVTFTIPGTYTVAFSVTNDAGDSPATSVIDIVVGP
jgi:hypothetical protein